jgi:FAD/FMN-containing dehydrogenase
MVGQGSVFGKLVTITTRTYKRPSSAVLATFEPDTRLVNRLMPSDLRPQWMILSSEQLLVGYVGDKRTCEYCAGRLPELGSRSVEKRTIDQDIAHRRELWNASGERLFRAALPPAKVKDFAATLPAGSWVADPAFGVVVGQWSDKASIRKAAKRYSGVVSFFEGEDFDFEPDQPEQRALLERLKLSFDPNHRLAPLPWQRQSS